MTDTTEWTLESVPRVAAPLRERVSSRLRQAIQDFELKPGQRLVERELIERLQVSRTTIRESLRELTAEGLVTVIPQRGAVVASITPTEAADLYDARVAIESLIVTRFIQRASDDDVLTLRRAVSGLRTATEENRSIKEILIAKDAFYDALIEGVSSAVLANILNSLHTRVSLLRAISLDQPGRPFQAVKELEAVVEAIAGGDEKAAAKLCEKHIRNAAKAGIPRLSQPA